MGKGPGALLQKTGEGSRERSEEGGGWRDGINVLRVKG